MDVILEAVHYLKQEEMIKILRDSNILQMGNHRHISLGEGTFYQFL